jgi:hypothetical protein
MKTLVLTTILALSAVACSGDKGKDSKSGDNFPTSISHDRNECPAEGKFDFTSDDPTVPEIFKHWDLVSNGRGIVWRNLGGHADESLIIDGTLYSAGDVKLLGGCSRGGFAMHLKVDGKKTFASYTPTATGMILILRNEKAEKHALLTRMN